MKYKIKLKDTIESSLKYEISKILNGSFFFKTILIRKMQMEIK